MQPRNRNGEEIYCSVNMNENMYTDGGIYDSDGEFGKHVTKASVNKWAPMVFISYDYS